MAGENLACKYLQKHGWDIVDRNVYSSYGEIDIVAQKGEILAFVEVKTRNEDSLYAAQDAVTPKKQECLSKTAAMYLSEHPTQLQPRFDVCEVYLTADHRAFVRYLENAFAFWNEEA